MMEPEESGIKTQGYNSLIWSDKEKDFIKWANFSVGLHRHGCLNKVEVFLFDCEFEDTDAEKQSFVLPLKVKCISNNFPTPAGSNCLLFLSIDAPIAEISNQIPKKWTI
jgi:hypothetical protein